MRSLRLIAAILLPAAPLSAQSAMTVNAPATLVDYGVRCQVEVIGYQTDEDTIDGEIVMTAPSRPGYDVTTQIVPATTGLAFGILYRLSYFSRTRTVDVQLSHPPMGDDGRTLQTWQSTAIGGGNLSAVGYVLEDDFELVEGEWVFQIFDGTKLLLKAPFLLVTDGTALDVHNTCDPNPQS